MPYVNPGDYDRLMNAAISAESLHAELSRLVTVTAELIHAMAEPGVAVVTALTCARVELQRWTPPPGGIKAAVEEYRG
jgi:hypothetical protein